MTWDEDDLPGWVNPWPEILRLGDRTATTREIMTPAQRKEKALLRHRELNRTEARKEYKKAWRAKRLSNGND